MNGKPESNNKREIKIRTKEDWEKVENAKMKRDSVLDASTLSFIFLIYSLLSFLFWFCLFLYELILLTSSALSFLLCRKNILIQRIVLLQMQVPCSSFIIFFFFYSFNRFVFYFAFSVWRVYLCVLLVLLFRWLNLHAIHEKLKIKLYITCAKCFEDRNKTMKRTLGESARRKKTKKKKR